MQTSASLRRLVFALSLLASAALPGRAHAAFIFDIAEVGPNVVVTGTGTLDVTDLLAYGPLDVLQGDIYPEFSVINGGPAATTASDLYGGSITGPASYGSGTSQLASTGSGDLVGLNEARTSLFVPSGYVSGTSLTDTDTYANSTFSALGVTPGTYTYTWGSGLDTDSLIINVGVPEPSSWVMFGLGTAALLGATQRQRLPGWRTAMSRAGWNDPA